MHFRIIGHGKPNNAARNALEFPAQLTGGFTSIIFGILTVLLRIPMEKSVPWLMVLPIALFIALRKARQRRKTGTPETLFTPEEREWWLRERRGGGLFYVLAGGAQLGFVVMLFFPLCFIWGSPPLGRSGFEALCGLSLFFFLVGCLVHFLSWITYEDDEREWQRKHAREE